MSTAEEQIAAIEARRALAREEHRKAHTEQRAKDLAQLEQLELEHGIDNVAAMPVNAWTEGLPTFVVVKSPGGTELYRRYLAQVRAAKGNAIKIGEASDMLGEGSIIYPGEGHEARAAMFKAFPGLKVSAYVRTLKFVELEAEEEKKD